MQEYAGLVRKIARDYLPYCGGAVDLDDLMQAGAIGAMLADASWAPEKGAWSTWASFYIRKEMRAAVGMRSTKRDPARDALRLDMPITEDGFTLADTLPSADTPVQEQTDRAALQKVVREEVQALAPERRRVVVLADLKGKPVAQIARRLHCTARQVSETRRKAHADLRQSNRLYELAEAHGLLTWWSRRL